MGATATGGCAWVSASDSPELMAAQATAAGPDTVLDRLWIFTCAANSDFVHLRRRSVMTPAEGAFFLGVPNIILTVQELGEIRRKLGETGRKLAIFVTLYAQQLDLPIGDYLELVDVITLWTSDPAGLERLKASLVRAEAIAPRAKRMLGCYLVDYGRKEGMPVTWMRQQCETGLRWLKEPRIEGIVFLGNTAMDLGFASVEWTREWIQKVGNSRL